MSGRSARAVIAWAAMAAAGVIVALHAPAPRTGHAEVADVEEGAEIYATTCAVCHGPDGLGGAGEGLAAEAPPLRGLPVAYVDQQLRTGRMPIVEPALGVPGPERLPAEAREAVVAWMTGAMELTGAIPSVREGDRTRGHELFAIHCAACHGSLGGGGIGAEGTVIRGLLGHDRVTHVEAIRVGPYDMPAFDEDQLSDQDASDIAEFIVTELDGASRSPLGLRAMHRYTTWGMAGLVALALLAMVVLLGRQVRFPESGADEAAQEPPRAPGDTRATDGEGSG